MTDQIENLKDFLTRTGKALESLAPKSQIDDEKAALDRAIKRFCKFRGEAVEFKFVQGFTPDEELEIQELTVTCAALLEYRAKWHGLDVSSAIRERKKQCLRAELPRLIDGHADGNLMLDDAINEILDALEAIE